MVKSGHGRAYPKTGRFVQTGVLSQKEAEILVRDFESIVTMSNTGKILGTSKPSIRGLLAKGLLGLSNYQCGLAV